MNISDMFSTVELTGLVTTTGTEAGPYVLALVGALAVIGVGVALLWKAKKSLVAVFR